jgi:hypothetical protein
MRRNRSFISKRSTVVHRFACRIDTTFAFSPTIAAEIVAPILSTARRIEAGGWDARGPSGDTQGDRQPDPHQAWWSHLQADGRWDAGRVPQRGPGAASGDGHPGTLAPAQRGGFIRAADRGADQACIRVISWSRRPTSLVMESTSPRGCGEPMQSRSCKIRDSSGKLNPWEVPRREERLRRFQGASPRGSTGFSTMRRL